MLGSLTRDEAVGCGGLIGPPVSMIPVTVNVTWTAQNRRQSYSYQIIRHRRLTVLAIRFCLNDASSGWMSLPEFHTVRHAVEIDFGKLGLYKAANVSSGDDISEALSDTARPVAALYNNPFGQEVEPRSIKIDLAIDPADTTAEILHLRLAGRVYRPGESVEGSLTVRPFRKAEQFVPVSFKLPDDLPDGSYSLTASDYMDALHELQREMPQRYDPKTVAELFAALQGVVAPQANELHLRLPLPRGGLALGQKELPDLPESRALLIAEANLLDTHVFTESLRRTAPSLYVLKGQAAAEFTVQSKPRETLLRP
jgi:hypothetical protein